MGSREKRCSYPMLASVVHRIMRPLLSRLSWHAVHDFSGSSKIVEWKRSWPSETPPRNLFLVKAESQSYESGRVGKVSIYLELEPSQRSIPLRLFDRLISSLISLRTSERL